MSNPTGERDAMHPAHASANESPSERVQYPVHSVLAVLDSQAQLAAARAALTAGGFLDSELDAHCGAAAADAVAASTGRTGLANLAVRIAERLGIEDDEMEFKRAYEEALRGDKCVIAVDAPSDERKERAVELLRAQGAHTISYHGRFTIEGIVPPPAD